MAESTFKDLKLTRNFLNALDELGFVAPTPIQEKSIPSVMGGQDVIGIAQTGTGKTAAYLLPLLQKLNYAQFTEPRALIFVPTRELALQVEEMALDLAKYTDLRLATVFGGKARTGQIQKLESGLDLLIATPGRFMDLYLEGHVELKRVKTLVLDEADRLMDMGFLPQLHSILEVIPRKRQNLLFSATFSPRVETLSEDFLEFPTRIEINPEERTTSTIRQFYYRVPNFKTKLALLEWMLTDHDTYQRILVFTRSKSNAENLGRYLQRKMGEEVRIMHANKSQQVRISSYEAFKSGELRVLVSTDVSARGIDVSAVSHVINFEVGRNSENYIHRIGRTGRMEREGIAISFVNRAEEYNLRLIASAIGKEIKELQRPAQIEDKDYLPGEEQEIAKELDLQKQKEDPEYKGAFHQKKRKPARATNHRKTKRKKGRR